MENDKNTHLKNSAMGGMFWIFGERMGAKLVSLLVAIVLARLLLPQDYSLIGIVTIFFTFCNVFIFGGLNTALIQKKEADTLDYSSVFWVTMGVALVMYAGIFLAAPAVAALYRQEQLVVMFRVMGLSLFINALKSVLIAYTSSSLQFRKFFFSTLIGTLVSAVVGIVMAVMGFGVWALVAQDMTNSTIDAAVLLFSTRMQLKMKCSFERLKSLFAYGWKNLASSMIIVLYEQLSPLLISLRFTPTDLAFYTKGISFPGLIRNTLSDTMASVLFPVMAKVQDDVEDVCNVTRRYIQVASYVIFPVMLGLYAVSDSFVRVVLTQKWIDAAVYIRIFCVAYMFDLMNVGNIQAMRAIGRSDVVLKLEIVKKTIFFVMLGIFVFFAKSPQALAVCSLLCTFVAIAVNAVPIHELIGYRYIWQILDVAGNLSLSAVMVAAVWLVGLLPLPELSLMFLQILVGAAVYVGVSYIARNRSFFYLLDAFKRMIRRRRA